MGLDGHLEHHGNRHTSPSSRKGIRMADSDQSDIFVYFAWDWVEGKARVLPLEGHQA
jgi:hypothetical protein